MNMLNLKKIDHNKPDFDELYRMLSELKSFLNEDANFADESWAENFKIIIDFQESDGSFKLLDSYRVPSDASVDFCYMPTYICTAILMKAFMTDSKAFSSDEESSLFYGLRRSCARNLSGHGFEGLLGQIDALKIFMGAGLNEFMDLYHDFCSEFSEMIEGFVSRFNDMEVNGDFLGSWGESYESDIRLINEYFRHRHVFVYGTLMDGECNHHFLSNSTCLGRTYVEGYGMYDVGWYPAIVSGNGMVIGELYRVDLDDIPAIDMLEGEGDLYVKTCECIQDSDGNSLFAFIYVYLGDCDGLERISSWKDYVWYVSYGSNMLNERFMCYIEGGAYGKSRYREACDDTSHPVLVRTVSIPYEMYFANRSGSWENGGVAFIDTSRKGNSLGVAYLITEEQFDHVAAQENGGRYPEPGFNWYEDIIDLGEMDGFKVRTITNNIPRHPNAPCSSYREVLAEGIRQNWPQKSSREIDDYLNGCIR